MDTTTARFDTDVVQASHNTPILVDFWAPWCGPCRVLGPVLEKLAAEAQGAWQLVKINTDAEPELASTYRIQGIPAVKLFSRGEVVGEFSGALPESAVRSFLEKHIPSPARMRLQAAQKARENGDFSGAEALAAKVLAESPDDAGARILLAELSLPSRPERAVQLVADLPDDGRFTDRMEAVRTLASLPAALSRGDQSAEPWRRYHEGIRFFLAGQLDDAIDAWIDVLKRNRSLDDDGVRKACVALFTWSGADSELTQTHHTQFASALF